MEGKMDKLSSAITAQKLVMNKMLAMLKQQPSGNDPADQVSLVKCNRAIKRLTTLIETDCAGKELDVLRKKNTVIGQLPLKTNEEVDEVLGTEAKG